MPYDDDFESVHATLRNSEGNALDGRLQVACEGLETESILRLLADVMIEITLQREGQADALEMIGDLGAQLVDFARLGAAKTSRAN